MKTSKIKNSLILFGLMLYLAMSCTEKYELEKLSGMIEYDPEVDAPLIRGSLTAEDLFLKWDSLLDNHGDTVVFTFRDDSLFYISATDFSDIPPQDTSEFNLVSAYAFPILPYDSIVIDSIDRYILALDDNMRLDSIFLNDGVLMIEVNSSFKHAGTLTINCPGIVIDGQPFYEKVQISSTDGNFHQLNHYPLRNAKIYVDNSVPGEGCIKNIYHLVLNRNPGQGVQLGDRVHINFSIVDLDKYEAIFGFAGNGVYNADTTFSIGMEEINGITGTFSVTDPRITINYISSLGLPIGIDMAILGYFDDGHAAYIDPPMQVVEGSDDYMQPQVSGSLYYDRTNTPNIGDLLTFPPPDSLLAEGKARANPDLSDGHNFVLKNSSVQVGIEIEVPLAFEADLQLRDTFKFTTEKPKVVDYVEYANLHYRIRNEFPVNLNPYIILYDSIDNVNLDTIFFTVSDSLPFIPAAPVNEKGVTIVSQVDEVTGIIRLDEALINNFYTRANKMIMVGSFSSYETKNVVILTTYKFVFRCNLEAKFRYQTNLNDTTSND